MIFPRLPAGLTALCLVTLAQAHGVCYFPNGHKSDDVPCDSAGATTSMCCSSKAACLSSGLCKDISTNTTSATKFIRATCTDSTWSSNQCPQYCVPNQGRNGTVFDLNLKQNDVHIQQCNVQGFGPAARFCCGFANEQSQCCDTPSALFELAATPPPMDPSLNPHDCSTSSPGGSCSSSSSILSSAVATSPSPAPISASPCSTSASTTSAPFVAPLPSAAASPSSSSPSSPLPTPSSSTLQTPVIPSLSTSTSTSTANGLGQMTTGTGSSDTTAPSTDPPTSVSSLSASASPTSGSTPSSGSPTNAKTARPSAFPTALADSTPPPGSSSSPAGQSQPGSPGDSAQKSSRLSTGVAVGVGLGASVAGAGLVTIAVYLFARRRLYKKQQKRWREQMMQHGLNHQGGPLDPGGAPGPVAVTTVDGRPAMVILTRQGTWNNASGGGGEYTDGSVGGPSPVSQYLRDMGWETRTAASSIYSGQETRRPSEVASPADRTPVERGGRTVTWLGRNSIYEMP